MVMYEHDPDLLRWGFDLLNGDPFSTSSYCGISTESDVDFYDGAYVREDDFGTDHTSLDSDETIAQALQEEFSQLAVAEATDLVTEGEEHFKASVLAPNCLAPSMRKFSSVYENGEDSDDTEPSSSCCSPGEMSRDGDDWSLELIEDYSTIDGELGKRLNLLIPVPSIEGLSTRKEPLTHGFVEVTKLPPSLRAAEEQ